MSATKNMSIDYQEEIYTKLVNLGADYYNIYVLEEQFRKCASYEFVSFAERVAGYAFAISILSKLTGRTQDTLWNIWRQQVQCFSDGESLYEGIDEEWRLFKEAVCKRL